MTAEDAFQATFLVLARRAASIGRREQLASWLYGVAVRTAKEARRRAARDRAMERRLMDVSQVESEPTAEDRDDLLAFLDEELNRLPPRYRAALVACELEGKSRREAAQQLGIPEGTLSTHLARGRKLLRERLHRRGVSLGVGPLAGLPRPIAEAAIPERLMGSTVRAALGKASGGGSSRGGLGGGFLAGGKGAQDDVPHEADSGHRGTDDGRAGAAAAVVLGLAAHGRGIRRIPIRPSRVRMTCPAGLWTRPARAWPTSRSGPSVAGGRARDGRHGDDRRPGPVPAAVGSRTAVGRAGAPSASACSPAPATAGSAGCGWAAWPNSADGKPVEIELGPVGDVRGR